MTERKQREELLEEIKSTGLIPSLKAQIRHSVSDLMMRKVPIKQKQSKTIDNEVANNIILEFLFANGFHSTASIFYTEAMMNQMSREMILDNLKIQDSPGLISELLLTNFSHPSVETQTDVEDLSTKLEMIEMQMHHKRTYTRISSSEDALQKGIEEIDREFEHKFQTKLGQRLDMFRSGELMQIISTENQKRKTALLRNQKEMEIELQKKTAELRSRHERDSDAIRIKQLELQREIGAWAERNVTHVVEESSNAEIRKIKEEANRNAAEIELTTKRLLDKLEKDQRQLEDLKLEHNRAKREVERLRLMLSLQQ